jgi:lipopolysaccharide/colanic/teichoic acid biosynthesis glycosyltransferase
MSSYFHKRIFDFSILIITHLVLAPIWIILWISIPIAIWIEDKGPIFYTQIRLGKDGKEFLLYKFRSMLPDAENETGAIWAPENDNRVTNVGKFLRGRALDELPQIINLWKGDLSLVGPRPERPEIMTEILLYFPQYKERLNVKPGLTGPAQVYGRYATAPEDKFKYDMEYIENMSLVLDVKLLAISVGYTLKAKWQKQER